ncbi:MAG TPA: hypothetical protein PLD49_05880 [Thermoclostridium caenicola]|uniref:LiaF transmembrane domain-containing protein n=1 Tax=Thermoclostridium caenicola TaxID=659425 RepID=A0A1M6FLI1_9FIRM|nr:hypothetical protein [Thermoclostridium caenicola]SHI98580.1 hypothetical protein SAMN05444373_101812 [Thermoclostridium caenicola]HOK43176.1 hypothetical protein [Thermoclostridium caenicola]HOL84445.1 hypothetical protein [Thermoclostridium caenicola]HOP72822.1 hypothetical protein [Thermoclostridium caenicola]HPO76881.1 hypothetical protein [Thermoclostridium caenicola]
MRKWRSLWGLLLIAIGILWLFAAADIVSAVVAVSTLWPVFIVAAGITLLLKKEFRVMRVVVWILAFGIVIGYGIYLGNGSYDTMESGEIHVIELKDGMEYARMEINVGAVTLRTGASDSVLTQVNSDIKGLKYGYTGGRDSRIVCSQQWKPFAVDSGKNFSAVLSNSVKWNLEFNAGAADGILDFSGFPLEQCEINSGTCDLRIVAGKLQDETYIECNGGVVSLSITLPQGTGIRIRSDSLVKSINGDGITLGRDGETYESSNYSSADRIINLDISSAVTHVTVIAPDA